MSSRSEWTAQVERAEAAGFEVVTVIDHFGSSGGVFPALLSAHDAAPTMRVGTMVLAVDFWNPAMLAREVTTADVLTDGGFELGLGAGWALEDYAAVGLERRPAPERLEKLEEAIGLLRQLLAGGPVNHSGKFFSCETGELPRPKQEHVPIVVGGGSRPVLELAGRLADVVSLHRNLQKGAPESWRSEVPQGGGPPPDRMAERVGWVRAAAGDRFEALELHALLQGVVVTDDRRAAAAELGQANGLDADAVLASPHYLVGTIDEMVADLVARRERWGISYWTLVGPGSIETFAPVVARLAGS
jgi:probable F420-dependent oxidoreductase